MSENKILSIFFPFAFRLNKSQWNFAQEEKEEERKTGEKLLNKRY
jgi:hypothetical protein